MVKLQVCVSVCVCICVWVNVCMCVKKFLSEVPFLVQSQMIGPGETSLAMATLERFGASVLAVMAGQLVRPGKAPAAADPFTLVRLFAYKREKKRKKEI